MLLRKTFLIIILCASCAFAADPDPSGVRFTVKKFFEAFHAADTASIRSLVTPDIALYVVRDGQVIHRPGENFISGIAAMKTVNFYEYIDEIEVTTDGSFATATTPYIFYLSDSIHHCGVNEMQMVYQDGLWRVYQVNYSHRENGCNEALEVKINAFLDLWHAAAASANEDRFFSSMAQDAVYLGTDPEEHWYRDELKKWAEPYFQRESAWTFTCVSRNIYTDISSSGIIWFDELLESRMGILRGSGVIIKEEGEYRIRHYGLSFTLPNDRVEDFRQLIGVK